jgi:hypothetical protein
MVSASKGVAAEMSKPRASNKRNIFFIVLLRKAFVDEV